MSHRRRLERRAKAERRKASTPVSHEIKDSRAKVPSEDVTEDPSVDASSGSEAESHDDDESSADEQSQDNSESCSEACREDDDEDESSADEGSEDEDESTVDERSMAEVVNVRKRRVSFLPSCNPTSLAPYNLRDSVRLLRRPRATVIPSHKESCRRNITTTTTTTLHLERKGWSRGQESLLRLAASPQRMAGMIVLVFISVLCLEARSPN